jgi:hypothetical protein
MKHIAGKRKVNLMGSGQNKDIMKINLDLRNKKKGFKTATGSVESSPATRTE